MYMTRKQWMVVRTLGLAIVATVGLSACATYDDEFAGINSRLACEWIGERCTSSPSAAQSH